ncbi:hypothetical protein LNP04_06855 [Chryseobacterium sp. C-71]|uniref:hypothetical protein n=1 Tax=Chryseobacterium sp. C-71 TaxID=2893882 RepID=UPI001E3A4B66|nr:hypothetical protein [Chryseobacterium sp. C-71]UFH33420.1 hypothetical protein LNP04_06855 [Chryseobacterium sp. C-71]
MFTGYDVGSSSLKASIADEQGKVTAVKPKNSESSFFGNDTEILMNDGLRKRIIKAEGKNSFLLSFFCAIDCIFVRY